MKLSWRTSITWRSTRLPSFLGSSSRKASKSSASNCLVGMNCQTIGPSLSPSSATPLSMKRWIDSPAVASTLRLVVKREAFIENMKSSGVSSRHLRKVSGLKVL
ncbi:hypothetical protein D9M69_472050 [compost metagenome]